MSVRQTITLAPSPLSPCRYTSESMSCRCPISGMFRREFQTLGLSVGCICALPAIPSDGVGIGVRRPGICYRGHPVWSDAFVWQFPARL